MALRLNLYGCDLQSVLRAIGSGDSTIRECAERHLIGFRDESDQVKAKVWLRRVVEEGYPLRRDRNPPIVPDDGGLVVQHLEAELHIFAVHAIVRAVSREEHLDLSLDSSTWHHTALSFLYRDFQACGFTRSRECPVKFFRYQSALSNGTPLFGDNFETSWSFYTFFENTELTEILDVFSSAIRYERKLPEYLPEDQRQKMMTCVSDGGKEFLESLSKWFGMIRDAGQDAYIFWS